MKITNVQVNKVENPNAPKMKGFATITIEDCFVVKDIRILESDKGLWVAMPSRGNKEEGYYDIAFPINQDTRDLIQNAILDKFNSIEE